MLIHILLRQISVMILLSGVGVYLTRKGYMSGQTTKELGGIMIRLIFPSIIINSYIAPYSDERFANLGYAAIITLGAYCVSVGLSWLIFGRRKRIDNFASAFTNAGFIGIPLLYPIMGTEGVFYLAPTIALLNILQWSYGVYILTDSREAISFKAIIRSPMLLALFTGLTIFICQIPVPNIIIQTLGYVANLNTPIAMLLVGSYMAKLTWVKLVDTRAYLCVFVRLILIPAVAIPVLWYLPSPDPNIILAVFIGLTTSTGANVCVYAQQYDADYEYSVVTVCQTTAMSVVTIPFWFMVGQAIFRF